METGQSFAVLDILVLFGLVLSLFLVVLLWSSRSFRSEVHQYYALAIISLNMSLTVTWFEALVPANGLLEIINWQFLFPFTFMMYALKAIKDPLGSSSVIWILIAPCLLLSLFHLVDFITDFDVFDWLSGGDDERYANLIEIISFSFTPFSMALVGFSYRKVHQAKNIYAQEKRWLEFNSLSILAFCILWLLSDFIAVLLDFAIWEYLLASLGIFLVVTTYQGVHHLNIFEQRRQLKDIQINKDKKDSASTASRAQAGSSKRMKGKIEKLHSLMVEDKLFLNPELTRSMVANILELSDSYLSELISTTLNTSFNDYINEFRVKRAIDIFNDRKSNIFSIEAIGYESGFKTKSVFYKAFKKVTQKTPGEYRRSLKLS